MCFDHTNTFDAPLLSKLSESWQIHKVFHAALLCPYRENEVYGENYIRPPPDIEEGEEVYKVEQILKHRKHGRGYKYLITIR
jgi:hypothetical protein